MQRTGREILFSADVDTASGRHYFHVAAQSAKDAYDQLIKRDEYQMLANIECVTIYDNSLEDRRPGQMPLKVVELQTTNS
ncbi:MAG TPA: hypothetical protein VLA24_07120 [Pseudomonadales bacterium]|nr:hypothetical protein [Pseudomonadales bacterium]